MVRTSLMLVALVVAAVAAAGAQGTTPGKNGPIYFENYTDATASSDVFSINPDGTGLKQITASQLVDENDPAVSPNGKQIALLSDEGGDTFHLHLMNADGSGERALQTGGSGADSPSWSPNGSEITFSRCVAVDQDTGDCTSAQIAEIGANGQNLRFLSKAVSPAVVDARPTWRPNGREIVFQRTNSDGQVSLWSMTPSGGSIKRILDDASDMDRSPSFEPNGRALVYASDVGGAEAIWAVNFNGHGKRKLFTESPDPDDPTTGGGTETPSVSPNGKQIVYTQAGDLWTASINGSNRKQLTTAGADEADWAHG